MTQIHDANRSERWKQHVIKTCNSVNAMVNQCIYESLHQHQKEWFRKYQWQVNKLREIVLLMKETITYPLCTWYISNRNPPTPQKAGQCDKNVIFRTNNNCAKWIISKSPCVICTTWFYCTLSPGWPVTCTCIGTRKQDSRTAQLYQKWGGWCAHVHSK